VSAESSQAEILVVGLSHRTAPVDLREGLAVAPETLDKWLTDLKALPGVSESTIISTCNRVEIYAASPDRVRAFASLHAHLRGQFKDSERAGELENHLYRRHGRAAIHHLFRVTSSLDSLVVGEPQILGQMKDAFETATRLGVAGASLDSTFQRAFRVARRVRRETGIARNPVSVSSVAVDMARRVFDGFQDRVVLLVGAGKMADLAARALKAQGARIVVTNRTAARAQKLAEALECTTHPFEDLVGALANADIVITSTGAREPVIDRELVAKVQKLRRRRSLVIVDIAVPRDVAPDAGSIDGTFLWDMDDLQNEAAIHLAGRREEAERAEGLVEEEVGRFLQNIRGQAVAPTIKALRSHFSTVAQAHLAKFCARTDLPKEAQDDVERLVRGLINELLHTPQVALKKSAAQDDEGLLAGAAKSLFALDAAGGESSSSEPGTSSHTASNSSRKPVPAPTTDRDR